MKKYVQCLCTFFLFFLSFPSCLHTFPVVRYVFFKLSAKFLVNLTDKVKFQDPENFLLFIYTTLAEKKGNNPRVLKKKIGYQFL
jgi:hypothetical protein